MRGGRRKKNLERQLALLFLLGLLTGCGREAASTSADTAQEAELTEEEAQDTETAEDGEDDYRTVIWDGETYTYNDHLSNFLFLGIDTRESVETQTGKADAGQADALYLISWDRVTNATALISIPRDTIVQIEAFSHDGTSLGLTEDHISLSYAYGDGAEESCELAETAVSRLFYGLPVQGVWALSLDGIPTLLDGFDNIEVTVPNDSLEDKYPEFAEGAQVQITAENAETFLRYRDTNESQSAILRMERQQAFLEALGAAAAVKYRDEPEEAIQLYDALSPYLADTAGKEWIAKLAEALADGAEVTKWIVPGEGSHAGNYDEYHVDEDAFYQKILETFYEEAGT